MNDDGYRAGVVTRNYLRWIGTYGKKKGASDYRAMKTTLRMLASGRPVLIFPEGQTTWDGETQPIYAGIEKIVKRSKCSLVLARLSGNFLCKPWWAATKRKGRTRLRLEVVSTERIAGLSEDEILSLITSYIYNNDIKDPDNASSPFAGSDLALGLERFVWMCRECRSEDELVTSGDTIACRACGASWAMDAHCRFRPVKEGNAEIGDLHDWAAWHKQQLIAAIEAASEDTLLTTSDNVRMAIEDESGAFVDRGKGRLSLTRRQLTFAAESGDEDLSLAVPEINDYVFERKDIFECRHNDTPYRFEFHHHSPMKWVYYFRYLNGYEVHEKNRYIR
jgi:1-acyl-sn-glycerol-3-phosphate acyltransferase